MQNLFHFSNTNFFIYFSNISLKSITFVWFCISGLNFIRNRSWFYRQRHCSVPVSFFSLRMLKDTIIYISPQKTPLTAIIRYSVAFNTIIWLQQLIHIIIFFSRIKEIWKCIRKKKGNMLICGETVSILDFEWSI